jgi:hypothetical protein
LIANFLLRPGYGISDSLAPIQTTDIHPAHNMFEDTHIPEDEVTHIPAGLCLVTVGVKFTKQRPRRHPEIADEHHKVWLVPRTLLDEPEVLSFSFLKISALSLHR